MIVKNFNTAKARVEGFTEGYLETLTGGDLEIKKLRL
jgi:hypothetical protein